MADDDPRPPRRWGRLLVLFVLAVLLVAGGAWGWLINSKQLTALFAPSGSDGVPVVRADPAPFKTRPSDPGGMEIPDRDKLVYQRLQGDGAEPRVEHLLPEAEKPIAPPRSATPVSPAPQVSEKLPRVPTEAQVRAAVPPPPPPIARALNQESAPEPEDSPPTAEETAPQRPSEPETASAAAPPRMDKAQDGDKTARDPAKASPPPVAAPQVAATPPPATSLETVAPTSGYLIQIAAVREEERAGAEWARLQRQHADLLRGLKLFVIKADLGEKGVFWRLRAGPFADETQAKNRCADLAKQKVGCLVVKAQG